MPSQNSPAVHVLHTQHDVTSFVLESAVICDNIGRTTVMAHLQFPHYLLADIFFCIDPDDLSSLVFDPNC